MKHKTRGRKDHYLPQGYLRGFNHPSPVNKSKPLWHYEVQRKRWGLVSAAEIGFISGFYDYSSGVTDVKTADETFSEFEQFYPMIRKEMIDANFRNWQEHRDFLTRYMQMMRSRSLLFREQQLAEGRSQPAFEVIDVAPDQRSVKVREKALPETFLKNRALTNMRAEIEKGTDWLKDFDWALRYTDSPENPCVTSEMPFILAGPDNHPNIMDALNDPKTLLYFPLCWQACLVGSKLSFDVKTDRFTPTFLYNTRTMYLTNAELYIVSPVRIDGLR